MKKLFTILSLFICSIVIGQYKSLDKNDTTDYVEVKDFTSEFNNFGYNYVGKNIILICKFKNLDNGSLSSTPESNKGRSSEGSMSYYDPKKVRELVGFVIDEEGAKSYFTKCYGYQKDILNNLKTFVEDEDIVILGKVVKWDDGEKVGVRVKYVYKLEDYNNLVETQPEESPTTTSYQPQEKSFFDIFLEKIVMIVIIIIVMGIFLYLKNRNKKED
jgi:hypothetical protein